MEWKSFFSLIGYLILKLIHGFYNVYLSAYSVYSYFIRTQFFIYERLLSTEERNYMNKVKLLNKIPKHLAIIIGSECIYYADLVKLISWCMQFGIKFTSFYQQSNCIEPNLLYETFYKYNKENARKIVWARSFDDIKEQVKLDLNGHTRVDPSEQLFVNILRTNDGEDSLVETTKDLCKGSASSLLLTISNVDDVIRTKLPLPDPDVAVVFGDTCASFGFPPWHLRVTEFVHLSSHHHITPKDFIFILERYNKCEQRFGK